MSFFVGLGSAQAADDTAPQPQVYEFQPEDMTTIYGGKTQSHDPTRYDYVPPKDKAEKPDKYTVTPMSGVVTNYISGFQYSNLGVTINVPTALLTNTINGSGLHVASEVGYYSATGPVTFSICNWKMQFQNRYGGTIYSTRTTSLHSGCNYGYPGFGVGVGPFDLRTGEQCARLLVNGIFRGESCMSVFP